MIFNTQSVSIRGDIVGPVCVCLFVHLPVCLWALSRLNRLTYNLLHFARMLTLTHARMELKVKVICQRSRSNIKIVFFSPLSEKKVRGQGYQGQVKVKGQVEGHRSTSPRSMSLSGTKPEKKVTKVKVKDQVWRSRSPRTRSKLFVAVFYPIDSSTNQSQHREL